MNMGTDSVESLVEKMEETMKNADKKLELLSMRLDIFENTVIHNSEDELPDSDAGTSLTTNGPSAGSSNSPYSPSTEEEALAKKTETVGDDIGIDPKLVREILSEVKRVRSEYDQLHDEIRQVQVLQQEVSRSVRKQMKQVQSHFDDLRGRIIGSGGGGNLSSK